MVPARADAECSSSRRRMKPAILVLAAVSLLLPSAVDAADSLQVRQVAACAPYVTQQHVGYVLLVRVPPDLVGAGSCGQRHSCCYVPCTMPTQQSRPRLPLALVEHAMHAGFPLGTVGTPVGCASATTSVFDWAGGSRMITAPQLPSADISHVFPRPLLLRHAWMGDDAVPRFVPIEYADSAIQLKHTWALLTQGGAMSLVAGRRDTPSRHNHGVLHALNIKAAEDARLVHTAADKTRDGGWRVTVSQDTKDAVRDVFGTCAGVAAAELAGDAWSLWRARLEVTHEPMIGSPGGASSSSSSDDPPTQRMDGGDPQVAIRCPPLATPRSCAWCA